MVTSTKKSLISTGKLNDRMMEVPFLLIQQSRGGWRLSIKNPVLLWIKESILLFLNVKVYYELRNNNLLIRKNEVNKKGSI